LTYDGRT